AFGGCAAAGGCGRGGASAGGAAPPPPAGGGVAAAPATPACAAGIPPILTLTVSGMVQVAEPSGLRTRLGRPLTEGIGSDAGPATRGFVSLPRTSIASNIARWALLVTLPRRFAMMRLIRTPSLEI